MRCSISLDLNSVLLSECNILGKSNLSIFSENRCIATVAVFLSGMGVSHKVTCKIAYHSEGI